MIFSIYQSNNILKILFASIKKNAHLCTEDGDKLNYLIDIAELAIGKQRRFLLVIKFNLCKETKFVFDFKTLFL